MVLFRLLLKYASNSHNGFIIFFTIIDYLFISIFMNLFIFFYILRLRELTKEVVYLTELAKNNLSVHVSATTIFKLIFLTRDT